MAQEAAFRHGRMGVARGIGRRAAGSEDCDGGRRAAKERRVRVRAAEHGMLPSAALNVFRRGDA